MPFSFGLFLFHAVESVKASVSGSKEKAHTLLIDIRKTYIISDIQSDAWVISAN